MRDDTMTRAIGRRGPALRERGVTLVELMVAMLLGLLLTAGAIQVFAGNRVAYSFNQGLARLQENGRFAIDTLNFRTRMAGYYGCLSEIAVTNNLDAAVGSLGFDFLQGLFGYEADGTAPGDTFEPDDTDPANAASGDDWTDDLHADLVDLGVIPGSDVLVVRNVSASAHALVSPFTDSGGNNVFADAATTEYAVGEIVIASDCQKASVFQITSIAAASGGIQLGHAASGVTPGNDTAVWSTDQAYGDGAELLRAETWVYFVGARGGDGPPMLFQGRLSLSGTTVDVIAEEIADGVDTMQVLYGIDSDLDGSVDEYETADGVADWAEVAAVRVGLLMRSPEEYGTEIDDATYDVNGTTFDPVDDRRIRQVFTTTIGLRNRLP
jgi:type IV pilus assembly protein PilW